MKIVFFGTPDYVVPILEKLHKAFKSRFGETPIAAVVTQKPQPVGRKKILDYSPVDTWAHKKNVPIFFDPKDILQTTILADLGILASYGSLIPDKVISAFPHGILNIHPSLLPRWRGASPVQATILTEELAGSTIMKIDDKLDHGPIVSQFKDEILPEDTTQSLRQRLFDRSADVLINLLPAYIEGKVKLREQEHREATFTHEIKKEDAFIPPKFLNAALQGQAFKGRWTIPFIKVNDQTYNVQPTTYNLFNFIRAMHPWPIAWTYVSLEQATKDNSLRKLKILKAHIQKDLVTSNLLLVPDLVQLEGKSPVSWEQFRQGYPEAKFS